MTVQTFEETVRLVKEKVQEIVKRFFSKKKIEKFIRKLCKNLGIKIAKLQVEVIDIKTNSRRIYYKKAIVLLQNGNHEEAFTIDIQPII